MGSGFSKMKKQARMLQDQYQKMRVEAKDKEVVGSSGAGLVTVTLNGEYLMKKIQIKPDCVNPNDIEGLEDLIKAAYNEASKKLENDQNPSALGGMFPGL